MSRESKFARRWLSSHLLPPAPCKRARTSPTGLTPRQASKRPSRSMISRGKKLQFGTAGSDALDTSRSKSSDNWTRPEELSLVRFVIARGYSTGWPTTKRIQFRPCPIITGLRARCIKGVAPCCSELKLLSSTDHASRGSLAGLSWR